MNKIINIILSGLLWRQYKFLIASLVLLIIVIFVVGQVHDDYIAFAQTSAQVAQVGWSFVVKWLAWLVAIILFLVSNHFVNARKEKIKAQKPSKSLKTILSFKVFKGADNADNNDSSVLQQNGKSSKSLKKERPASSEDPFAHLRDKEKLRSFADLVIEKHDKK
jgi:hypothetical protein